MTALVQFYDSDGATPITGYTFPDIQSGLNARPKKFGVLSLSDRVLINMQQAIQAIAGNDGSTMVYHAVDTATLSPPYGSAGPPDVSVSAAGAGGVFAATGTYGYKVVWFNANGDTVGSFEALATITATTQKVTLTWNTAPAGATGARVYRTSTPGTYVNAFRATIGATNTYTDDGSATSAGAPSTDNRTAGWGLTATLNAPGTGGVWGATGNEYWRVVAYQDLAGTLELANSFEATVNVDNVTKSVTLTWAAVAAALLFKVFRSTVSGTYASPALVATLAAGSTTYTDLGAALSAGAMTTTPSYGIPPAISLQTALSEGNISIEQMYFFWVQLKIPIATPEVGNPRLAYETAQET